MDEQTLSASPEGTVTMPNGDIQVTDQPTVKVSEISGEGTIDKEMTPPEAVTTDIYVGSTKVTPVTLPNGLISVDLDGIELKATQEQFDAMKSDVPYEDGLVSIRKWRPTIAKIVAILVADNTEMQDKDFIMQRVDSTLLENFRAASAKLFGVEDNGKTTLQQIIDILNPKV